MRKRALLYLSPGPVEDAADHGADDVVEHVLLGVPLVDVARADEQQAFPLAERDGAGVLDNLMEGGKTECEGDDKEEGIVRRKAPAQVEAVEDDGRGEPEVQVDVEIVLHAEEMPLVEVERPRGVEEQEHRKEQVVQGMEVELLPEKVDEDQREDEQEDVQFPMDVYDDGINVERDEDDPCKGEYDGVEGILAEELAFLCVSHGQ